MPRRRGASVGLPGYAWDKRTHNYRDLSTGTFVKRDEVLGLLRDVNAGLTDTMADLGAAAARGDISPRQFVEAMRITTKHAYTTHSSLAVGGWDRMTPTDWGRVGGHLGSEYRHLSRFGEQVAAGELSEKQIVARARLYSDGAHKVFGEIEQEAAAKQGAMEELFVTQEDERVCPICLGYGQQGWVSVGTIPVPPVHFACRCHKEFRIPPPPEPEPTVAEEIAPPKPALPPAEYPHQTLPMEHDVDHPPTEE